MSKQPNIRWRDVDNKELTKTVRNFNAKINRLLKKNPNSIEYLPEKLSTKNLRSNITNRSDFNRIIKESKQFSQRGAEKPIQNKYGIKITEFEKKKIENAVRKINRQRAVEQKKLGELEVTTRGQKTGNKRKEMGSVEYNSLKPKKFNFENIGSKTNLEQTLKQIEKQISKHYTLQQKIQFRQNYIKGLSHIFNSSADDLIKSIMQIDIEKWYQLVISEQEAALDFIYDPLEAEFKLDILYNIWDNIED